MKAQVDEQSDLFKKEIFVSMHITPMSENLLPTSERADKINHL